MGRERLTGAGFPGPYGPGMGVDSGALFFNGGATGTHRQIYILTHVAIFRDW